MQLSRETEDIKDSICFQTIEANSEDELLEKAACLTTPLTTSDLIIEPSGGSNDFFMRFLIYEL